MCVHACTWAMVLHGCRAYVRDCMRWQAISSSVKFCFCGSVNSLFHLAADFRFHSFPPRLSSSVNLCFCWWLPTAYFSSRYTPPQPPQHDIYIAPTRVRYPTLLLWTSSSDQRTNNGSVSFPDCFWIDRRWHSRFLWEEIKLSKHLLFRTNARSLLS